MPDFIKLQDNFSEIWPEIPTKVGIWNGLALKLWCCDGQRNRANLILRAGTYTVVFVINLWPVLWLLIGEGYSNCEERSSRTHLYCLWSSYFVMKSGMNRTDSSVISKSIDKCHPTNVMECILLKANQSACWDDMLHRSNLKHWRKRKHNKKYVTLECELILNVSKEAQ